MSLKQYATMKAHIQSDNRHPLILALSDLDIEKRILWIMSASDGDGIDDEARGHQMWRIDEAFEKLADLILEAVPPT